MMTTLLIVRHGETEWNVEGRLQGSRDSRLTERGRQQSEALGRVLESLEFHAAYSSDLGRAVETALILTRARGVPLKTDRRLREISYGDLEGLTWTEIERLHPRVHSEMEARRQDFAPPGGESREMLTTRVASAILEIAREHLSKTVLVVTHGGALSAFFRHVLGISPSVRASFRSENCALNRFVFREERFHLSSWGEQAHLDASHQDR